MPVLESLLDAHTLRLPCDARDLSRGADALAAATLRDDAYLTTDTPAAHDASAATDADAEYREVDVSSSLLVLNTDLAANALKAYLPPRDLAAPLPVELDAALVAATNELWPRKAFVGRIALVVPFIGPDAHAAAPAGSKSGSTSAEAGGAANW